MNSAIDRLGTLSVSEVMAKAVVSVPQRQPMGEVAALFLAHQISSAPVVDEQGACVGILTATDFLKRDAALSEGNGAPHAVRSAWVPEDTAETYKSGSVQSISAAAPLLTAAKIMCIQHVHRLPVVDLLGKPVGIISTMDVVAALLNAIDEMNAVADAKG
jgi:CBS domain-containing protein